MQRLQQLAAAPPAPTHGVGRASHRGGAKAEPRPGAVEPPTKEMAGMSIGGAGGDRGPRDRAQRYIEPHTRPASVANKQGMCSKLSKSFFLSSDNLSDQI